MDAALRALNRFGLGARLGERQHLGNPRRWLKEQLDGDAPLIAAPPSGTAAAISDAILAFRMAAQPNRPTRQRPLVSQQPQRAPARQRARRRLADIATAEGLAALAARVSSDRPFVERLVAFWSNHLCVSTAARVLVVPLAGHYERDVIRPHVLGRFEEMLLASAKHPAMLIYLDNFQSIGPNSHGAQRRRGRGSRGLNENYARELLELHTLGVNGGYSQQDVQELARILTGWTLTGLQRGVPTVRFAYQSQLHEPGARTVLGIRYVEAGVTQGDRVVRDLCRHPSTARFIATKLATHFVADDPPTVAVDRIAEVFRASDGDLRAVAAALIDVPEAWSENTRKFRTPQDWLVAVLRAFNSSEIGRATMPLLRQLRHPLWAPQAPKGFGDSMREWADPDSLLNRAELARTLARRLSATRIDARDLLDVVDVADDNPLRALLSDSSIAPGERLALALAGPVFQWR